MLERTIRFSISIIFTLSILALPLAAALPIFEPQTDNLFLQLTSESGLDFINDDSKNLTSPTVCVAPPTNLVSWYRAEGNANDAQATNNGTLEGGADFAPGKVGNGVNFDAPNEHLLVPASPSLNVGAGGSLTLEAWVNPTSPNPGGSGYGPIFEWGNGSGVQLGRFNNGQLFANIQDTGPNNHFIFTPNNTLAINEFQHVALTYTNATGIGTIYVNGIVIATLNLGSFTPRTNSEMRLGLRGSGDSFNGIIDEAAIYNRALSQTEIQAIVNAGSAGKCVITSCTPQPPNGVTWFKAENNGSDSLGTNDGTMLNGADFAPGIIGSGFRFDAPGEQLLVPASPSLNVGVGGSLTLEAWVNPTSPNPGGSGEGPIIEWGHNSGVLLGRQNNGQLYANVQDAGVNNHFMFTPDNTLTINQFQHVALTYTNATGIGTIYVNGVVILNQNLGSFTPRTTNEVHLGLSAGGNSFNGIIDEAAIYNRALSQTEIQAIFNAGSAGKCDAPLRISPITANVAAGGTINFTASGGAIPRTFSILTNNSGGSINPATGVYTAGATFGTDTVRVTDANNQTSDATVTVAAACLPNQKTWDGGGATNNWSEAANWTCDLVPTPTDTIIFDGTGTKNATIDTSRAVNNLNINTGYIGTITQADATTLAFGAANSSLTNSSQAGGTFVCGSGGIISFNTVIFTQTGGQFDCQNGTISNSPSFDLRINGGTFNAPSGTMIFGGTSLLTLGTGGTFNHNNGTIHATGSFFTFGIVNSAATLDFNNLTIDLAENLGGAAAGSEADDKLRVLGTLNLVRGSLGTGTIEAQGAVNVSSTFLDAAGGSGFFVFGGGGSQTYTNNGGANPRGVWTINKTSGTVTAATSLILLTGQPLNITSGTLYLNSNSNLRSGALTIGANGRLVNDSSTTITLGGNLTNDGMIDLQGGGANCPETDSILIRSSNGFQRSWTGGGRYQLVDVDVQNMGGTGTKTVFSGTNSGGNNASWVFNSGCPTALSIAPLSANVQAGATQTFTGNGGFPDYTFSILTNNSVATINPTTGVYTAGTTSGVTDTVRVTDNFGSTSEASVNVIPAVNRLAFVVQPSNTFAGVPIAPSVQVAVQNPSGNTITTATNAITIAVGNNPNNGTLSGTLTRNAVNGIATFDNLSINKAGSGYTLTATSVSLNGATTNAFNITNPSLFVTNTNDSGAGSLRQAITDANNTPGIEIIRFIIAGTAPFTIPSGSLSITQPVIIDGTTQPGFAGSPIIELRASNGNPQNGISISGGGTTIRGLVINRFEGSQMRISGSGGNIIQGNYIGTNVAGNAAVAVNLTAIGILISGSSNNLIGGSTASERNVISGNSIGLFIVSNSNNNIVQGNFIGTNAAGANAVGNNVGIFASGNSHNDSFINNIISGNFQSGILINEANNNLIQNNIVGLDASGTNSLGNGSFQSGIRIFNTATGIRLTGNRIFSNGGLGIQLNNNVPLPNDPQDTDTGANNAQNYPVLTSANSSGSTIINGSLNSTPSSTFTLEFFSSRSCDASGNGEGEVFLGSSNVTTDAGGISGFTANLPVAVAAGRRITATATDAGGNTSEFSRCLVLNPAHIISGRITLGGQPLRGVQVTLTGGTNPVSVISKTNGEYTFNTVPTGGNYTVTPVISGLGFSPPSIVFNNLSADQTDQNFVAIAPGFTISGQVQSKFAGTTTALGGATITLSSGATRQTDNNGNYVFNSLPTGDYTLTATKSGYAFTPPSYAFAPLGGNQTANFTAQLNPPLNGRVAFVDNGGDLFIMNADGSAAVKLATAAFSPAISPNGSKIAFTKFVNVIENSVTYVVPRVFTMNSDGTNQQMITPLGSSSQEFSPVWSPDGTKIAFRRSNTALRQIQIINLSTMSETTAAEIASGTFSRNDLSWSPDGTKIAFEQISSTSSDIRVANASGSGTNSPIIATLAGHPSWSPDGTKVAFIKYPSTSQFLRGQIALMNPNGTNVSVLPNAADSIFAEVDWSPDGAFLAFTRSTQSPPFGVISADGSIIAGIGGSRREIDWGTTFSPPTSTGSNVNITTGVTSVTFSNVSGAGQTTVIPIPPSSAGTAPNGFVVGSFGAYEINTTANVTPPITVCFTVPVVPETVFNQIVILHNEGGILVAKPTTRQFSIRRVCAVVNSLSPFVIAEQVNAALPSITGLAQDTNGNPLVGAEIKLTGAENRTAITDSDGAYTFPNLTAGANYNVQPKQVGYIFAEYSQDFVSLNGENSAVFVGAADNFQISGRVINTNGDPISGAIITLGGAAQSDATTDASGNYSFTNLPADGTYVLTVSNGSNSFAPPQIFVDALTSNIAGADFTQFAPTAASVSIGGRVSDSSGNSISKARVSMTTPSGETRYARTSSFGYYRFDEVEVGQTYVFNIASKRHQFQPQVVSVNDSITDLNFTALP